MAFEALNLFDHMEQGEVQWLLAAAEVEIVDAGAYIVREGEHPSSICFIADGLLEVTAYSGPESIVRVGQLGAGDIVGEISWLDQKPASASVMATETCTVLRLPLAALEERLAADPRFSAHFLRGVATLAAERLRKTTAQLRGAGKADRESAGVGGEQAIARCVAQFIARANAFGDAAVIGATTFGSEREDLGAALRALELELHRIGSDRLSPVAAETVRQELRPYLARSTVGGRCVTRPRGQAGDFATLELIYTSEPTGNDPFGAHLDKCLLEMAGLRGVRGRSQLIKSTLEAELAKRADVLLVTCLGSGAAPELFELLAVENIAPRLGSTAIDVDREAVSAIEQKAARTSAGTRLSALHANLLHLATGRDELELDPQDIIYSASLFDGLRDDAAIAVANWSYRRLKANGSMIVGALSPANTSRQFMEAALEWPIIHRSEADLTKLLRQSSFGDSGCRIVSDPTHPGFLAIASKT